MLYTNTLALEGFINNVTLQESGLHNQGVWFIEERQAGRPLSDDEKKWVNDIIKESIAKKKYMVINELWEFIPERLKNAQMFNSITKAVS